MSSTLTQPNYSFTPQTLQTIIDKNLTLFQYFDHLYPILKQNRTEGISNDMETNLEVSHKSISAKINKAVPKINHQFKNTSVPVSTLILNSSGHLQQSQEYSLSEIQQVLNSRQFILSLHPYINSLLTTTNIGIVKQTLKIHTLLETNIQKTKALHRVKDTINIFTLHQIEKNATFVLGEIENLNHVFSKIGLIVTPEQFKFYYRNIWDAQEEIVSLGHPIFGRKQNVKNLQIYDLLPLAVELEEIQVLKNKLRQWMSSQQFLKYHRRHKKKVQAQKQNCKKIQIETNLNTQISIKQQCEALIDEDLNVIKLRIQYLGSMELLDEVDRRGYNDNNFKQWQEYRNKLLDFLDIENQNKKLYNNIISCKSSKTIHAGQLVATESRRQNQQKQQQQAFNKKVLNGYFLRQQIISDLEGGNVEFLDDVNGTNQDFSKNNSYVNSTGTEQIDIDIINEAQPKQKMVNFAKNSSLSSLVTNKDEITSKKQSKSNSSNNSIIKIQIKQQKRPGNISKKSSVKLKTLNNFLGPANSAQNKKLASKTNTKIGIGTKQALQKQKQKLLDNNSTNSFSFNASELSKNSQFNFVIQNNQNLAASKKQNSEIFFQKILQKVKSQFFYGIGSKINMKKNAIQEVSN